MKIITDSKQIDLANIVESLCVRLLSTVLWFPYTCLMSMFFFYCGAVTVLIQLGRHFSWLMLPVL